ncbi:hypothetical protein [Adhaeretor mobilis]|uniref:Uncharacterized protein n=1 Tax=Adhaeretor mobilis TaxID=1930276 RepID=A0A517N373_9BACT|nr:hypothetical protein [Adhaeretor mobilis]QDT01589.1 hypothetical protein HG15A2_49360 [Adhaeretor mobilis]
MCKCQDAENTKLIYFAPLSETNLGCGNQPRWALPNFDNTALGFNIVCMGFAYPSKLACDAEATHCSFAAAQVQDLSGLTP